VPYRSLLNIIFAKTTQISVIFFAFPNFRKVDKFAASSERPKAKSVSARLQSLQSMQEQQAVHGH